eukprot:comp20437_c0_seq2/m.25973 comp20437_c0_seq2/g.25973  ORF comp20437_c0_seq2/g.25973 comp20437_c0_seq2/m.25973 type:complete len:617 (-) comp20437_c0_seq2:540-2390(-)
MAGENIVLPFNIGDVVWAKINNVPWWPCKVLALDEDRPEEHNPTGNDFLVNFLGEKGIVCEPVKRKNIKPYWSDVNEAYKKQGRAERNKSYHDAFLRGVFEAELLSPPPASQNDEQESAKTKNVKENNHPKQADGSNDERGSKRVREGKKEARGKHRRKRQKGEGNDEGASGGETASVDGEEQQPVPAVDTGDSNAQRDDSGEDATKPPSAKKRKTTPADRPPLKRAGSGRAKTTTDMAAADGGVGVGVPDEDELPSVQLLPSQTPGTRVGDIVWVKHQSYPFWPAVIERVTTKNIWYCFLGTMDHMKLRRRSNIDKNVRVFPGNYKEYLANGKTQLEKRYQKSPETKKNMIEVLERSAQKAREVLYKSTRMASGKKQPRPDTVPSSSEKYPTVCRKIIDETVTEETEDIVHASQVPPEVRVNGWQERTLDAQSEPAPENGVEGGGSQDSQRDGEEGSQEEERPSQESDGEDEDDETEYSQAFRERKRTVQERYTDNVLEDMESLKPQLDRIWAGTKTTPRSDEFRLRSVPNKYFYSDLAMWWVVPDKVLRAMQQWLFKAYKPPIDRLMFYNNVMFSEALLRLVMKREGLDYAGAEKFLLEGSNLPQGLWGGSSDI